MKPVLLVIVVVCGLAAGVFAALAWRSAAQSTNTLTQLQSDVAYLTKSLADQQAALTAQNEAMRKAGEDSNAKAAAKADELQKDMEKSLAKVQDTVNQQTAVMHRALGKVIPVQMPADFEQRFKALEASISSKDQWPKTAEEAQNAQKELVALMKQLPAWAEEDYLPRLNPLRWSVQAILTLRTYATPADAQIDEATAAYDALLSSIPDGVNPDVSKALKDEVVRCEQKSEAGHREAVLAQATAISEGQAGDAVAIWQQLAKWESDPKDGEKITALRKTLREKALHHEAEQQATQATIQMDRITALPNVKLRQQGLARLYETTVNQRLAVAGEGLSSEPLEKVIQLLDNEINKIIKDESKKQADQLRAYQKMALDEIIQFWTVNGRAEKQVSDRRSWTNPVPGWGDDEYKMLRDAMIAHLLPISPAFLDPPVAAKFNEAFQFGWQKLDKRDDQTELARRAATVAKRMP